MIRRKINDIDISLEDDKLMQQLSLGFYNGSGLTRVSVLLMGKSICVRITRQYRYLGRNVLDDKTISYTDKEGKVVSQLNKAFKLLAHRLAVKKSLG